MGMVHVVRARKQGYAHRYSLGTFLGRFGHLTAGLTPSPAVTDELTRRYVGHNPVTDTCLIRQLPYTDVGHNSVADTCLIRQLPYTAGTSGTAPRTCLIRQLPYTAGTSGTAPPTSGVRWSLYSPGWSQHPC